MRKSKQNKLIEQDVNRAFNKYATGVQIDIFNIGPILEAGRLAGKSGHDIDEAVKNAVELYKKN